MKEYMEQVSVEEAMNAGRTDTICWDCKNAIRGGCSWANPEQAIPVKGWTAVKTVNGYRVCACPEFIRETYGCGRYRNADDYILALETSLNTRKQQVARLKKAPGLLRKKNTNLTEKNKNLTKQLDIELWHVTVHMSD